MNLDYRLPDSTQSLQNWNSLPFAQDGDEPLFTYKKYEWHPIAMYGELAPPVYHVAEAICHFGSNFQDICTALRQENNYLVLIVYKHILDFCNCSYNLAIKLNNMSMMEESEEFAILKNDSINFGDLSPSYQQHEFDQQLNELFSPIEGNARRFIIVKIENDSTKDAFLLFQINPQQALLFHPYRNYMMVVSKEDASEYIIDKEFFPEFMKFIPGVKELEIS